MLFPVGAIARISDDDMMIMMMTMMALTKHQQCLRQLVRNIYGSTIVLILTVKFYFREFSDKKINFLKHILDENGNIKTWENILQQHNINKQLYFK